MVSNEKWFGASAGFYNGVATQSLRFNDASSNYLTRTPASAGSLTTWTWSGWFKIGSDPTLYHNLFTSNTNYDQIRFDTSSRIIFAVYTNNGATNVGTFTTKQVFKDCSNWYHFVFIWDTTNSTSGDRQRMYVNGVRILNDDLTITQTPSQNAVSNFNSEQMSIGRRESTNSLYLDGHLSEINFLDGTAVTHTQNSDGDYVLDEFGEFKNGVWIPKEYSGSYGTNGFRLEFKQTGDGSSTASSTTIGADTSGNNNHFLDLNFDSYDSNIPDSPENNFMTFNPLHHADTSSLSNMYRDGSMHVHCDSDDGSFTTMEIPTSGKWYFEMLLQDASKPMGVYIMGNQHKTRDDWTHTSNYTSFFEGFSIQGSTNKVFEYGGTEIGGAGSHSANTIYGFLIDVDNSTYDIYQNDTKILDAGTFNHPSSNEGAIIGVGNNSDSGTNDVDFRLNAGQDSSFQGQKTSGSSNESDANGIGNFYYSTKGGLAICSANLPDTTLSPNQSEQADDHFNTVLYTGNNTARDITVGFATDWAWTKIRNASNSHYLFDSSRGVNKALFSDATLSESSTTNRLTAFNSDGFSLGTDANVNSSSYNYVAWNWRCGGSSPTKTYKVVVVSDSGNKYRFRNSANSATFAQSAVTLDLQEGGTYVFDWSDSTAQGHPIRFSTTSDGTHGGGSAYTSGVVNDDSNYKTTITVPSSAPTLYYYCANHSGMGGQINTNTSFGQTNFDGSILSVSQTNETSGFSIATYTGTGSLATVGHGLGSTAQWVIIKKRSASGNWVIGHHKNGFNGQLYFDSGAFSSNSGSFNNTAPTDSVVTINTDSTVNTSSATYVMYCFTEIEGFSKFGSYTGNASTNGTFVYLGFKPSLIILKRSSASGHWQLLDNKRNIFNSVDTYLLPSLSNAEYDGSTLSPAIGVDFLSNGFKLRTTESVYNGNNATFIYVAFAEQTFKFSNAR